MPVVRHQRQDALRAVAAPGKVRRYTEARVRQAADGGVGAIPRAAASAVGYGVEARLEFAKSLGGAQEAGAALRRLRREELEAEFRAHPASVRRRSALSVRSQVNAASSRPKCP